MEVNKPTIDLFVPWNIVKITHNLLLTEKKSFNQIIIYVSGFIRHSLCFVAFSFAVMRPKRLGTFSIHMEMPYFAVLFLKWIKLMVLCGPNRTAHRMKSEAIFLICGKQKFMSCWARINATPPMLFHPTIGHYE